MNGRPRLGLSVALAAVVGFGCSAPMKAATPKKSDNKPTEDGSCPGGHSLCGTGVFATCVDLQRDVNHCGECGRECSPGIACQAGTCQQTLCTGPVVISDQPVAFVPHAGVKGVGVSAYDVLADVNGDGHLDMIDYNVLGGGGKSFRVAVGQPAGGFAAPDTYQSSVDIVSISAADMNGDGNDDLLVLSAAASTPPFRVEVWLGHSDGHLSQVSAGATMAGTDQWTGAGMAVGDLSGDGWPDLVMAQNSVPGRIDVFLSDGAGALRRSKSYPADAAKVYLRDWDGDGRPDIVALATSVSILYNRGDGTFGQAVDCGVLLLNTAFDVVLADFNHDTRMDLAMSARTGSAIGVVLNLGDCRFTPIAFYDVPNFSLLRAADMNGDGQPDLVAIGVSPYPDNDHFLSVLLGNPDGTFQPQGTPISLGREPIMDLDLGELTGDGRPDIVVRRPGGQIETWGNACQ